VASRNANWNFPATPFRSTKTALIRSRPVQRMERDDRGAAIAAGWQPDFLPRCHRRLRGGKHVGYNVSLVFTSLTPQAEKHWA